MALRSKALSHGRSLSLPSKSHPAISQFTETLAVIKASEPTSSSLSSMENRLNGLKSLYYNIDDLFILPRSFVPKLVQTKKVSNEAALNEFNKVDSSLLANREDAELVNQLKEMDSSIQAIEEELQCLFRHLIKTRVFLLNILNL